MEHWSCAVEDMGITRVDPAFWAGRRVLVTGQTGFKGAWATLWLAQMGAKVYGYARPPAISPSLFQLAEIENDLENVFGDLADRASLASAIERARPQIVLHFAAQALVRRAYHDPIETFATNVIGTANLLESLKTLAHPELILIATTDKVYRTSLDAEVRFAEEAPLGATEPYGASKVAQEMVARAYGDSYFEPAGIPVLTARAGNVIGGGDFADDRLVPDIIRALTQGEPAAIRHPDAIRPWQHVLDCLAGYFLYVQRLNEDRNLPRSLNFGPVTGQITVGQLATSLCGSIDGSQGWQMAGDDGPPETKVLQLDSTRARHHLGWSEHRPHESAVAATAAWYQRYLKGQHMRAASLWDIRSYMEKTL